MGFIGVRFEVEMRGGEGGGWFEVKSPSVYNSLELCYKFEIWYVSAHTYVLLKNIHFGTKARLILLMSAFSPKIKFLLAKIVPLLKAIV